MLSAALKSKTRELYKSRLLRQASVLVLGKSGAQILALISYPILTRWYSSAQFGEFAFINSLLAILLITSSGHYDAAIVLGKRPLHAKRLFQLAQWVLLAYVLLLCLVLLLPPVQHYFQAQEISYTLLLFLPLLVLCGGYFQIVQNWLVRFQEYNKLSLAIFLQRGMIFGGSLLAIYLGLEMNGLVLGLVLGAICTFGMALYYQRHSFGVPVKRLMAYAHSFRDFPLYSSPTLFINTFTLHLPVLWLNLFHSPKDAGHFSMAFVLISVPIACLELSFGQIFYQQMAQSNPQQRFQLLKKYGLILSALLLPTMLLSFFFSEAFTVALLGESWRSSGKIVSMLGPLLFASGLINLLNISFIVFRKQKVVVYSNLFKMLLWIIALGTGWLYNNVFWSYRLMSLFSLLVLLALGASMLYYSKKITTKAHQTSA